MRVWDQAGKVSDWSAPARWTNAILHPEEWTAHWIAAQPDGPQVLDGLPTQREIVQPLPLFRKDFRVSGQVKSAVVSVSGLGQYELHLNGRDVTSSVLNPGWTNYRKQVLYNTFDVTQQLQAGDNTFGVMMGNGMYHIPDVRDRYSKWIGSFGQPKLILEMHITYQDGTKATVTSDASWQVASGPITFSSVYGGEDFDARQVPRGWDLPHFNPGARWQAALDVTGPDGVAGRPGATLSSQLIPPIIVAERLTPIHVTQPRLGITVYDLGKNSSGWPEIVVRGTRRRSHSNAPWRAFKAGRHSYPGKRGGRPQQSRAVQLYARGGRRGALAPSLQLLRFSICGGRKQPGNRGKSSSGTALTPDRLSS